MGFVLYPNGQPNEDELIAELRHFVENSDLSFYRIASLVGTTGTRLSMWLAGTAKPKTTDLTEIERFLNQ
jgi:hypothetical protein